MWYATKAPRNSPVLHDRHPREVGAGHEFYDGPCNQQCVFWTELTLMTYEANRVLLSSLAEPT